MKQLNFNILDNKYLEVADFTWYIKRIDAIYISHTAMGYKGEYAIFVQSGSEIVELYYRTIDEVEIYKAFESLCKALIQAKLGFDRAGAALINYNNVISIKFDKGLLSSKIITKFNENELIKKNATKALYNQMQQSLKNNQIDNSLIKN